MKKVVLTLITLPFFSFYSLSQVGIGTISPSPRSVMEISSTSNGGITHGGFIPPRVASIAQRDAISPGFSDVGMILFVEATGCLQLWDGDSWENISCVTVATPEIWINEIHYDDVGADEGEGFEIAGVAGTDLSDYEMVRYNGPPGIPRVLPLTSQACFRMKEPVLEPFLLLIRFRMMWKGWL